MRKQDATGENDFTPFDFRDIIAKQAADIVQPDQAVAGGFTAALWNGELAAVFGLP